MDIKHEKVESSIKGIAAAYFGREAGRTSLLTVTNCSVSDDMRSATIYITVMPADQELNALNFAKRKRKELRDSIKKNLKLRNVPFVEVEIDKGEKHRQRIDELLRGE